MRSRPISSRLCAWLAKAKPESAFLLVAGTLGLALLGLNPPFQAPDESEHFNRVFQLSEGTVFGEKRGDRAGGDLPQAVIDGTNTEGIAFHPERKMTAALFHRLAKPGFVDWARAPRSFSNFPHTVVYAPVAYVPQTIAVFAGRHLHIGPLGLMYLARLAGLAASVAMGYAALRTLPCFRWTLFLVLLCPMSLYLLGSAASDGLLICGAALLLAHAARLARNPDQAASVRERILLVVLAGALAVAKPVYLPLAAVAYAAAAPGLATRRRKFAFAAALLLGCVLPALLWSRVALGLFVPANADVPLDPSGQAHLILTAPWAFLGLVVHTVHVQYATTFRWMVGTLGWIDTSLPDWYYPLFGWGALACLLFESAGSHVGWRLRGILIGAVVLAVLFIYAAQYCDWNAPGSTRPIDGVEGRYFLPLLPFAALALPRIPLRVPPAGVSTLAISLTLLGAGVTVWAVTSRYYLATPSVNDREGRLVNVSTQSLSGSRENVLVTGLVVKGFGKETLLIRATGPSLTRIGLPSGMDAPLIRVTDAAGTTVAATDGTSAAPGPQPPTLLQPPASPFRYPADLSDVQLIVRISEGSYSVTVSSRTGASGPALSEIYEVGFEGTRLTNLSTRAYVGKGPKAMRVGLTVSGGETLLLRVDGPVLKAFGVTGVLQKPEVALTRSESEGTLDAEWTPNTESAALARRVGAFPLPVQSSDRAAIVRLSAGGYRLHVTGKDGEAGVALVEVYEAPADR
jgi:uncharacterized membrane protein